MSDTLYQPNALRLISRRHSELLLASVSLQALIAPSWSPSLTRVEAGTTGRRVETKLEHGIGLGRFLDFMYRKLPKMESTM